MRKPLTNKKNGLSVSIALILGIVTTSVNAQITRNEKEHIEVDIHDSSGQIVRSGTGECWHTHFGQAEQGECNSTPLAKTTAPALINKHAPTDDTAPINKHAPTDDTAPINKHAPTDDTAPINKHAPIDKITPIPLPIQTKEPVAVRELPIVPTKKLTFDASGFFDFGEPILRPSARAELDDFVEKLKETNPQTITVIGHADRIGSAHYNQILSEQRAATVKAYLVRKGVSPDILLAEGKGDTQPITKNNQCPSDKTPKTIECLQPDRRVEVEMTGTKTGP